MKFQKFILLIFILLVLVKPIYADSIVPAEVDRIERLSSEAFCKPKFFKQSEKTCLNGHCGTVYTEINRPEKKAYCKITGENNAMLELIVIDEVTYEKSLDKNTHINNWKKAKIVPKTISGMLNPTPNSCLLKGFLKKCPTINPNIDKVFLEEGLIDGKDCYIVNIVYPESKDRPVKTLGRHFYQKNSYLPYGEDLIIESTQVKFSIDGRTYDYDVPVEIKLPQAAINAKEVAPDEIGSLH